jgi:hypothetical protein
LCEGEDVDEPIGDDYPAIENIPTAPAPEIEVSDPPSDIVTGENVTPTDANTDNVWYEVKRILKTKRQRGKDLYLVEWADSPTNSWVERKDLTDYALQAFYASRPPRRRRRRHNY